MPHDWLFLDSEVFNVTAVHLNRLAAIVLELNVEKSKCPLGRDVGLWEVTEAIRYRRLG